tara:strand:+ start:1062 stop:1271 length:210 start_codon:yes stop_codon:yes gene_type:complete
MQIGDLIKVKDCKNLDCMCFFCHSNSNRVGFIATLIPQGGYAAIFDIGEWDVFQFDEDQGRLEVMNESR